MSDRQDFGIRLDLAGIAMGGASFDVTSPTRNRAHGFWPAVRLVAEPPGDEQTTDLVYPRLEVPVLAPSRFVGKQEAPPPGECLDHFIRLGDASEERILAFAQKWGLLGLCAHRKPFPHSSYCDGATIIEPGGPLTLGDELDQRRQRYSESVEDWRLWSRHARALLCVIADLRDNKPGRVDDWQAIAAVDPADRMGQPRKGSSHEFNDVSRPGFPFFADIVPPQPLEHQRSQVAVFVNHWLGYGRIQPEVAWWQGPARIHIPTATTPLQLTKLLAIQLAAALTSSRGVFRCDGCGNAYEPRKRAPRANVRRFCPTCQGGESGDTRRALASKRLWRKR